MTSRIDPNAVRAGIAQATSAALRRAAIGEIAYLGNPLTLRINRDADGTLLDVITGYPDSEILSRILSHGAVTVIKKPIEYEQLNRAVKQLGHKGAMASAS
jgi:DNA-binding NtrC family response regulator